MIRSLLLTAYRRLVRHRGFVSINVLGLAVGLAATLLLGLFVEHEVTYDDFHEDAESIYRLVETPAGSRTVASDLTRMPVLPTLLREMPEARTGTRIREFGSTWIGSRERRRETITYVDSTFFEVFSFDVVHGDARTAVSTPGTVALTISTARRLFNSENPIGQTIDVGFGEASHRVVAIVADPPSNSTVQFDILASRSTIDDEVLASIGGWYNRNTAAYVRLADGSDPSSLRTKLTTFSRQHFAESSTPQVLDLRPLTGEHARVTNSRSLIALLSALAVAILLIAGFNFMNLMTARGLDRVSEVGMRQALGARRRELAAQFLFESTAISVLAFAGAALLVTVTLPSFNALLDLSLTIDAIRHGAIGIGVALALGLLVGFYPAVYLTRVTTANALRGHFQHSRSGLRLRRALVVVQFALSIILVAGAFGVWQQVDHLRSQDPGLDQENVVVLQLTMAPFDSTRLADARLRGMRDRLLQTPGIQHVSFSGVVPTAYDRNFNTYVVAGGEGRSIEFRQVAVDQSYFQTLGIPITQGRSFQHRQTGRTFLTDEGAIINEAAARRIRAVTGDSTVIGTSLSPNGASWQVRVRGITAPFRHRSAARTSDPVLHFYSGDHPSHYEYLSVRLAPGTVGTVMDRLRAEWAEVYPRVPFDYFFVDDAFDRLYRTQERIGILAGIAAVLAALIACLGLFSLAAFTIHRRIREISIRRVLGATVPSIVTRLSGDFLRLVALAFVVAVPLVYVGLNEWLQNFATRMPLGPGLFLATAGTMALLALATVGIQATRAALTDPAEVLQRADA